MMQRFKALSLWAFLVPASCGLTACSGDKPTQLGISQPAASPSATLVPAVLGPLPSRFNRLLVGTIDGKHAIQMELGRNDDSLYGRYFYERNADRKYLDLSGELNASGQAQLTEMAGEKQTGVFTGTLVNEIRGEESALKFTGTWAKTKGAAGMPVVLAEKQFDLGGLRLIVKQQKEDNKKLKFTAEIAYPQLAGNDARAAQFNKTVSEMVDAALKAFKDENREAMQENAKEGEDRPGYALDISYTVEYADKNVISLLVSHYSFTGGAHGNTGTTAYNYDLNRGAMLKLADLFQPSANYLKVISDYCIAKIKKSDLTEDEWIRTGAGPKTENYESWNITPEGLQITFDAYQVAAYAAGPQEVVIPYSALKAIIKPGGVPAAFVK